jgi:hypothetical protein
MRRRANSKSIDIAAPIPKGMFGEVAPRQRRPTQRRDGSEISPDQKNNLNGKGAGTGS